MKILGSNFHEILREDLGEEALAWIESSNADLVRAPHPPSSRRAQHAVNGDAREAAARKGGGVSDEPLDGETLLVED